MDDSVPPKSVPPAPVAALAVGPAAQRTPLSSVDLFAGAREVHIRHNGETYRLQETRSGKLILVK